MMVIQQEIYQNFRIIRNYKLIGIDLSGQKNTNILQQINFVGKLEEDNGAIMFFISQKQQKAIPIFFRFINCHRII